MDRGPLAWRLALRALPGRFRERHRDDLEAVVAEHLDGRGRIGRFVVWTRAAVDTVVTGVRMRWTSRNDEGRGEGRTMMDRLMQDLGFAWRALRRRPGFTALAVTTLGVGIGATTAVFSVVNGVLLRPLPYHAADRIGILWHEFGDGAQNLPAVHALDIRDYRDRSALFETFTMATGRELILGEETDPEVVDVGMVEAGFFEFLRSGSEGEWPDRSRRSSRRRGRRWTAEGRFAPCGVGPASSSAALARRSARTWAQTES